MLKCYRYSRITIANIPEAHDSHTRRLQHNIDGRNVCNSLRIVIVIVVELIIDV